VTFTVTVDTLLYWLDKIQPSERSLVGDQAFYLSQQAQAGRAVIPGFAIAAPVLREFLATSNWSEPLMGELLTSVLHINVDHVHQLKRLAQHIHQELCGAELPEDWVDTLELAADQLNSSVLIFRPCLVERVTSIRAESSQNVSQISGLLESRICPNRRDSLSQAWKETWAELFSARSLFYWQRAGISLQDLDLAILVQPVWNAIAAGSLETRAEIWEIKATWGLGMSIPAGKTIPDYYQVNPATGQVQQQTLGNKLIAYHVALNQPKKMALYDRAIAHEQPDYSSVVTEDIDVSRANNLDFCQCIQPLIIEPEQQQQYAFQEPLRSELIRLTTTLVSELGDRLVLEWVVCPTTKSEINENTAFHYNSWTNLQLYLAQVLCLGCSPNQNQINLGDEAEKPVDHFANSHQNHPWLVGVGAAPGEAIAPAFVINPCGQLPKTIPPKKIIVTKTIDVDALFCLQEAAGVICEYGGMTSHAAILARELGIPAVVGVTDATKKIHPNQGLLIDGDRGRIYQTDLAIHQKQNFIKKPENRLTKYLELSPDNQPMLVDRLTPNFEAIATQIMVNLSHIKSLEKIGNLPVDGVGLLRSELMILEKVGPQHPQKWIEAGHQEEFVDLMSGAVSEIAQYFFPRPVFYRCCDLRSDEYPGQAELNPALGSHGAFSYQLDSSLFELELAVIDRVQTDGYTNINLILPFVRSVEEFVFCRQKIEQTGLTRVNGFQLWIMAEVPSVLFLLDDYIKAGVQGIAIGTNDLTQLLLGVDRNHPQFQHIFERPHPAVKSAIRQLIYQAKSLNIPCSICGQAVVMEPKFIDDLVRWGVTVISVEPNSFETTYRAIARSEKRLLLEAARRELYP
jgi:pyruvate,water dikinase